MFQIPAQRPGPSHVFVVGLMGIEPTTFCSDLGWIGLDDLDWLGLESLENQRFQTACFLIGFARDSVSERLLCLNRVWRGAARNATNDSPTSDYATPIPNQTGSATFKSSATQYASSSQDKK